MRSSHFLTLPLLLMAAFSQLGCAGPLALSLTREKYNAAVQKTTSEQLLLNLVRLRYRDPPSFMKLSSLSTQFVFDQTAFANGQLDERSINQSILRLGAAAKIEQRPTVTYDMLQGQEFVRRLISPADVESIILLIRSGWSADRVLRMTVQQINGVENARTASGPTPKTAPEYGEFQLLAKTLRELQLSGEVRTGYETSERRLSGSIPKSSVQADDFIAAAKEGWHLQQRQDRVTIATQKIRGESPATEAFIIPKFLEDLAARIKRRGLSEPLRVRYEPLEGGPERSPFVTADSLLLRACQEAELVQIPCIVEYQTGKQEGNDDYYLIGPTQSLVLRWNLKQKLRSETKLALEELPNFRPDSEGHYFLEIEPRSMLGTMYFLSHGIEVPLKHAAAGLVTTTTGPYGEPFSWFDVTGDLLHVRSQKRKPKCAAVAVKYRDHWFYIDDQNLESKSTFALLLQLFELQAGGGAASSKPVLTLSVGN